MMDQTNNNIIRMDIADLGIQIICNETIYLEGLRKRYVNFISSFPFPRPFEIKMEPSPGMIFHPGSTKPSINYSPNGQLSIRMNSCSGEFSLVDWMGVLEIDPQAEIRTVLNETEYGLRCLYAFMVFKSGGILVHASGIIIDKKGYLFVGKSGAGKSTIVRNSKGNEILGDDMLAIFPSVDGWLVMSTPFTNPDLQGIKPKRAQLGKLYYLRKSLSVYCDEISSSEALAELLANVPVVPYFPEFTPDVIEMCKKIVDQIFCRKLFFLPDRSFLNVI